MRKGSRPPEVLDSAEVLEFAHTDASVPLEPSGPYIVADGKRLGYVPCLVIARNQYEAHDILLFFCDAEWHVLAAAGFTTVAEAKRQAQKHYPGISKRWQQHGA
jgi:hypothetical protein